MQADIVDVIITGKVRSKPKFLGHLLLTLFCFVSLDKQTDNRYTLWGGGTVILGRVRIQDGLVILVKYLPVGDHFLVRLLSILPYY
jgi:hypothetical protein